MIKIKININQLYFNKKKKNVNKIMYIILLIYFFIIMIYTEIILMSLLSIYMWPTYFIPVITY